MFCRTLTEKSQSQQISRPCPGTTTRPWWILVALVWLVATPPSYAQDTPTTVNEDEADESEQAQRPEEPLPKLNEIQRPPSYKELINAHPFDWVIINVTNDVMKVEALDPRPDTMQRLTDERMDLARKRRRTKEENVRLKQIRQLVIQLPGDSREFAISWDKIDQIIGIEELMLERVDLLIEAGDFTKAWDLIQRVQDLIPEWDQTQLRFFKLLLKEAETENTEGRPYRALALLDEAHEISPGNTDTADLLETILEPMISEAVKSEDFRKANWLIDRCRNTTPEHPLVQRWDDQIRQTGATLLAEAEELSRAGEARQATRLARRADRIWHMTGQNRKVLSRIVARYQTVRVGVDSLNNNIAFPVPLAAAQRHRELTQTPLFSADKFDEITYFRSAYIEDWDPQDLGRKVTFRLRSTRPWWQPQPILRASQVADALALHLDPDSPDYDARLASFVSGYTVRSPTRIEIRFKRVPLNMAALFRIPVYAAGTDEKTVQLAGGYHEIESSEDERSYLRNVPEPDGLNTVGYHVAEVIEKRFDNDDEIVRAFRRGTIDVMADVRPWMVEPIRRSDTGSVQQLAFPSSHLIVFNPQSTAIQNVQLRRALSLAVPRELILQKIILQDDEMTWGRLSGAAWPESSYASAPGDNALPYNLYLAHALSFAALEQLKIPIRQKIVAAAKAEAVEAGGEDNWDERLWRAQHAEELEEASKDIHLQPLTMLCEPDPIMRKAAEKMIEMWDRIGISVSLVVPEEPATEIPHWDMMYRQAQMEEPLLDVWSVLLTDDSLDINLLEGFPDWFRQDLTLLDYVGSFRGARNQLFRLQKNMAAQAFLIPLWEVDQFAAFRKSVTIYDNTSTGQQDPPVSVYDNVSRWVVKP